MSHWIPREISHRILHLISLSAVSIYHAFQQVGQLADLYQKINKFRKNICLLVITSHRVKITSKFSQVD